MVGTAGSLTAWTSDDDVVLDDVVVVDDDVVADDYIDVVGDDDVDVDVDDDDDVDTEEKGARVGLFTYGGDKYASCINASQLCSPEPLLYKFES